MTYDGWYTIKPKQAQSTGTVEYVDLLSAEG